MIVATVVGVMPRRRTRFLPDLCDLKLRRFHVLEQVGGAVIQQFSGFGQADALAGTFK